MRLGFPTHVFGTQGLPSHDARPLAQGASLSISLAYLRDLLYYMHANAVVMYRLHDALLPGLAQRDWDDVAREIDRCADDLALVGALANEWGMRLSFHPQTAVVLNTPNEDHLLQALTVLRAQAMLLDALSQGPEAVIVLHVGGVYGDEASAEERFVARYQQLGDEVRRRVVLENDDRRFGYVAVSRVHAACGVPLVLDTLHHQVLNHERITLEEALHGALATWPAGVRPKVHYATPRSEMRTWGSLGRIKPPTWTEHADFINPFDFASFCRLAQAERPFDVMLEAKARDLAVLKLRQDLARFAPELSAEVH